MNHEIKPFYVGQEVVANRNSDLFKKGQEFIVNSCWIGCCGWNVTVGIVHKSEVVCYHCKKVISKYGLNDHPFAANCFSPKLEIRAFISMVELAEKQLEHISAN